jgi:uncharacterized protein
MPTTATAIGVARLFKVLLITGDDVAPAHDWKQMSQATCEVLEKSGRFEVEVSETLAALDSKANLDRFDLIFLTRYSREGTLSAEAKQNLLSFVHEGKGFALSHLASASFPEWTEFQQMVGRYWVMGKSGHGPRCSFKVTIARNDSPVTHGLEDFHTDDELYGNLQGAEKIDVLATAESEWSRQTEPLAFTRSYGKGRVFHELFGHDGAGVRNPPVAELIVRGAQWAAQAAEAA